MFNWTTTWKIGVGGLFALVAAGLFALSWHPVEQHQIKPSALTLKNLPYGHYKDIYPVGNCIVTIHSGGRRQVFDTQETLMTLESENLSFKIPNIEFEMFEVSGSDQNLKGIFPQNLGPIDLASNLSTRLVLLKSLTDKQVTIRNIYRIRDHYLHANEREGCTYFVQDPKDTLTVLSSQRSLSTKDGFDFLKSHDSGKATVHLIDKINMLLNLKVDNQRYRLETDLRFFVSGIFFLGLAVIYFIPIRYSIGLIFIPSIVHGLWLVSPVSMLTGFLGLLSFPLLAHHGNKFLLTVFVAGLLLFAANILFGGSRVSIDQVVNLLLFLVIATLVFNLWIRRT